MKFKRVPPASVKGKITRYVNQSIQRAEILAKHQPRFRKAYPDGSPVSPYAGRRGRYG
jgi:hypothetical protein